MDLTKYMTEQQTSAHGEVHRPEFDRDYGDSDGDVLSFDGPDQRQKVERFVLRNTPHRHRYKTFEGQQGITYFDARNRAASCALSEIPDEDLIRVADQFSKRRIKPQTGRRDHGYVKPVQETKEPLGEENRDTLKRAATIVGGFDRELEGRLLAIVKRAQ